MRNRKKLERKQLLSPICSETCEERILCLYKKITKLTEKNYTRGQTGGEGAGGTSALRKVKGSEGRSEIQKLG